MGVFVDGGDDLSCCRVRGEPVALAHHVPLADRDAREVELYDGAVQVAARAGLALRADAILEADEDVPLEEGDVVGVGDRLLALRSGVEEVGAGGEYPCGESTGSQLPEPMQPARRR